MNILCREVLKDLREEETRYCTKKLKDIPSWKEPEKRLSLYCKYKTHDADHWFAEVLETYKKYPIFENSLITRPGEIIYNQNDEKVRLTADLLTNADAVSRWVNKHPDFCVNKENLKLLSDFYLVSYTRGNFSPIWNNFSPGDDNGKDNVWNKLPKSTLNIEGWKSVFEREDKDNNNLRKRNNVDLFMILPKNNPKDVITQLYFVDYYDYYWNLLCGNDFNITKIESEKEFVEFLKQTTVLIVQRSYRIFVKYMGNVLRKEDKNNLEEIFNQLKYKNYGFIYSKKEIDK